MKKKRITILIALIGIAVLGLISIQGIWLKNAYGLKEQQFRQLVNSSITGITNKLQYSKEFNPPPVDYNIPTSNDSLRSTKPQIQFSNNQDADKNANINVYSKIQVITESGLFFDSVVYQQEYYAEYSEHGQKQPNQPREYLQSGFEKPNTNSELRWLPQRNIHLTDRISPDTLQFLISDHLNKNGVSLKFEYAVFDEQRNFVMHSDSFNRETNDRLYAGVVAPNRSSPKPNYLVLYFPSEKEYLRHSLGFMSISAIVLTLVILFAFGYTLFFIYNQKRVSEIRTDFVNNMTHELKTPISTISLASQMLHDPSIPTESKNVEHLSKVILDESKRLSFQVERVLQTAIFEKGKMSLKFRQVDVNELINSVVKNFIIQVKNKNGQIIKNLDAEFSLVNVDEVHFANVLLNLLDNAIKYSREAPSIIVTTFNKKGNVAIKVQDNGIGIKKEDQKKVFEQFYRVPTGNVHNVKGFGLGLSYVKKIVEEHGGKISVQSEFNVGTTFEIVVPVIKEIF